MFGLTTTRRLNAELAAAHAETNRQRERAERAESDRDTAEYNRSQVLRGNTVLDAANRDLFDRNLELGRRLAALTEGDPEYAASLERRLRRALAFCARLMDATWSARAEGARQAMVLEKNKIALDAMQARLDHAGEGRPVDGAPAVRDVSESAVVRQEKARADALATQLAALTLANHKCTCQRPLAGEGVAS